MAAPSTPPADPPSCPAFNTARSARVDAPSLQLTLDAAPYYARQEITVCPNSY